MKKQPTAAQVNRSRKITRSAVCQALEGRLLFSAFEAHVNMEPAGVAVPAGYVADVGMPYGDRGNGMTYGWDSNTSVDARVRTANPDLRYNTYIHSQKNGANHSWRIAVPNGTYTVHMVAGDADYIDSVFKINANGTLVVNGTPSSAQHWIEGTATVSVTNGVLAITNATGAQNNKIDFIDVVQQSTPVVVPPVTPPPVTPPVATGTPFGGTPALAGQPIQAENYDLGGEGVAYHDSTKGNVGKAYRTDDVDVQAGGSNGYDVGSTLAGEWMNYTITVPATGSYVFTARVSAPASGAQFHAEFDRNNLTGALAVPNSGGWKNWNTVTSSTFQLTAGTHVMRVVMDKNLSGLDAVGNFDTFNVTPVLTAPALVWTAAAPSPVARYEGYSRSFNGKLYVFGGFSSITGHYTNSDYAVFDPAANTWTSLGQIPCPTAHAGVAFDENKGIIYFVGGLVGPYPSVASTSVYTYDIPSNTWSQLPPLPVGSAAGSAVLLGNQLHYFAGIQTDHDVNVNVHYVLNLGDIAWHSAAAFPMARDHISAVALNGKIYSFGGEIGHDALHLQQTEVDVYDPATDAWTQLADMPMSKSHAESSIFVSNGKVVFAGGQIDNYASSSMVLVFDPAANTWAILGNLPGPLQGTFLQPVGNKLVLTNGYDGTNLQSGTWIADWTNGV